MFLIFSWTERQWDKSSIKNNFSWKSSGLASTRFVPIIISTHGHNPRRNGRTKVLGRERTQRHILPLLNVPGRPVIHENHAENVLVGPLHPNRLAHLIAGPNKKRHLELKVNQLARTEDRRLILERLRLTVRPPEVGARDDDRAGAAMVAHRQMQPIRHQRIFFAPEYEA